MPSESEIILTFLFNRSGKSKLSYSNLYLALSMDLNWFTPKDAKTFINSTIKQKLLSKKGETLQPTFDHKKIVVPVGFVPSKKVFEEKVEIKEAKEGSILNEIIEEINKKTKLDRQQITEKINAIAEEKNITPEVSALLVGKEFDVPLNDFFEDVEKNLIIKSKE